MGSWAALIIYGILLIVLGLLASPSLILAYKPNAKQIFDKIAPWQGIIGLVFCILGIVQIVDGILEIGSAGIAARYFLLVWITWLLGGVVQFVLGFILGWGLIGKYISSANKTASEKGDQLLKKLLPLQSIFAIVAILLGAWTLIYILIFIKPLF